MPVAMISSKREQGKLVPSYQPPVSPGLYPACDPHALDLLIARRRRCSIEETDAIALQKTFGKDGEREKAATMKPIVRSWQRQRKAADMWIRWFEGASASLGFDNWPIELARELDDAFHAYELGCVPWNGNPAGRGAR